MKCELIIGPPAAGKTTYVQGKIRRGDILLDLDEIFRAFSLLVHRDKPIELLPYVYAARDAVIDRLWGNPLPGKLWITATSATIRARQAALKQFWGEDSTITTHLDPGVATCLERVADRAGDYWPDLVSKWYRDFQALCRAEIN